MVGDRHKKKFTLSTAKISEEARKLGWEVDGVAIKAAYDAAMLQ